MSFRIGLAQVSPVLGNLEDNLQQHLHYIERARQQQVELLVFPELSLTGYYLRDLVPDVAMTLSHPTLEHLRQQSRDISLVVSFVEERSDYSFRIAGAYLEQGEVVHVHHKVYLPTYGMFDEERYLSRGDTVRAFDTRLGRMGMLICEDVWHLSAGYIAAMDGAQVLLVLADSPGRGVSHQELDTATSYQNITRALARLFGVYVVFVNRVGFEEGVNFWGGSMIVDPLGQTTAQGPLFEEAFIVAELSDAEVRRARLTAPLLRDERLDLTIRELKRIRRERSEY